jgi:hypothetical protein
VAFAGSNPIDFAGSEGKCGHSSFPARRYARAGSVHRQPNPSLPTSDSSSQSAPPSAGAHRRPDGRTRLEHILRENAGAVTPAVGKLSDAVSVLVQYLKRRGDPPERVVIEVKQVVRAAYRDAQFPLDPDTRRLVDNVITWAIEAYYGVR